MLARGSKAQSDDQVFPEQAIKDPFVLEFLHLKDEYSQSDLEEALISRLEILCSQKDEAVARYALDGLPNKVMAAEYRTTLPDEDLLASNIVRIRAAIRSGGPTVTAHVRTTPPVPTGKSPASAEKTDREKDE